MQKWEGYQNGINIGGWLSQCVHTKEHYNSFITVVQEKDGAFKDEGFSYIIKAAEWCSRYGLNMVLDLHKTAGYSFDAAENEHGFFESQEYQEYQEMFYKLWEEFARVFGGNKSIAFELLNEVAEKEYCGKWNGIAGQCIGRIRKIEGSTPIIIGGYWNNSVQAVKDLPAFMDENIIYNIHCYEPYIFTHQGAEWINGMPGDFRCSIKEPLKELRHKCEEINPGLLADFDGVWDSGS